MTKNKRDLIFILATVLIGQAVSVISSFFSLGWWSASAVTLFLLSLMIGYALCTRSAYFAKLLAFGFIVGLFEIFADYLAVNSGTLFYFPGGPSILVSPIYMPLSWTVALVQMGVISILLLKRIGLLKTSLILAVVGSLNLPFYEAMAKGAEWWVYQNTAMILDVPYYVIIGEFLICMLLPLAVNILDKKSFWHSLVTGLVFAGWLCLVTVGVLYLDKYI